MEVADRINRRLNDADLAVHLLKENRNAMHYRDIVVAVRKLRNKTEDPSASETAQILTQINLDSRFVHIGKGLWSLKDFSASVSRNVGALRNEIDDDGIFIDGLDDDDLLDQDSLDGPDGPDADDADDDDDNDGDIPVAEIADDDSEADLIEVVPLDDILAEEERDEDDDERPNEDN